MAVRDYIEEIANSRVITTGKGDEVHTDCLFCDDTRHRLYINLENHKVYCHNCGYNKSFINFIKDVENCSYEQAKSKYKEIRGSMYIPEFVVKELRNNLFSKSNYTVSKRAIPLPTEFIPLNPDSRNLVSKRAFKYLGKRGISTQQIDHHKMGYCIDGDYANRIVIPIWEEEELKFWVARSIGDGAYRKEMSPTNEDYQISKSQVIFNITTACKVYNSAVISEGIFDACSWGDIGISLLGKRMYEEQLSIILGYKKYLTDGVYIALDNDAQKDAYNMADELIKYMPVKLVTIPNGFDDPNYYARKRGRKALFQLLDTATEYSVVNKLKQKFFHF